MDNALMRGLQALDEGIAKRPVSYSPIDLMPQLDALYESGMPAGEKTGWKTIDPHYTVMEGQMTIVTGWPGSGKSEWLDALLVNLAAKGWRFKMFSPENQPVETHISKLVEKVSGKPFGFGPTERITRAENKAAVQLLAKSFRFMATPAETGASVTDILAESLPWLMEAWNKRGLIIDPWNELEHWRPNNLSETEYVSKTLSQIRNWARSNKIHVWIVAHPAKARRDESGKLPIPKPDMISGSQHWWNKADCAVTVWRDFDNPSDEVDVHIQKVRFKHIGKPGMVTMRYDRVTGRYFDIPPRFSDDMERAGMRVRSAA